MFSYEEADNFFFFGWGGGGIQICHMVLLAITDAVNAPAPKSHNFVFGKGWHFLPNKLSFFKNHILFSKTNIILLSRLFTLNTPRYFLDFASYKCIYTKSRRETPSFLPHLPPLLTPPFYVVGGPLFLCLISYTFFFH